MPPGKLQHSRERQTAAGGPVVPTFCLTLPDGMSLTSVVLEGIGSNGRLLTGPSAPPWRQSTPGGKAKSNRTPEVSTSQFREHLLNPSEFNVKGTQDTAIKDVDKVKENTTSNPDFKLNTTPSMKSESHGSDSTAKGNLWGKVKGLKTGMRRTTAVLTAFRPKLGRFYGISRLVVPLAGWKTQVSFCFCCCCYCCFLLLLLLLLLFLLFLLLFSLLMLLFLLSLLLSAT